MAAGERERRLRATPDFDFALGETATMIRDAAARFADERIAPLAARVDREDWFPRELWPAMGELGLLGATIPPDHKLAGNELKNFSAFLRRRWRENDWMWGRLDAVPTLVDLLSKGYPADA